MGGRARGGGRGRNVGLLFLVAKEGDDIAKGGEMEGNNGGFCLFLPSHCTFHRQLYCLDLGGQEPSQILNGGVLHSPS